MGRTLPIGHIRVNRRIEYATLAGRDAVTRRTGGTRDLRRTFGGPPTDQAGRRSR
jgi:hypothetical protein